ncbi:MAG TPA: 6-phosphogluconolactonase [Candidatus Acidoferrum sp.]|nr:6-phosphogluconolactonase [Candidatus Acidoferrum sp.]
MKMDTRVFADIDALSRAALAELLRVMGEAVRERDQFLIALSGGHTPEKLYQSWAESERTNRQTPWEKVHLFWGDERYVSKDDPLSNYRMTREALIAHVPIPAANVHRMPGSGDFPTAEAAADAYESELRRFFGSRLPALDLQLLGLGVEGHTASLFPGSPALEEQKRWVRSIQAPAKPPERLTLTPVVLNQGRNTFFLVSGGEKRDIIRALRGVSESMPSPYPAGRIRPASGVVWFLDQAAAS